MARKPRLGSAGRATRSPERDSKFVKRTGLGSIRVMCVLLVGLSPVGTTPVGGSHRLWRKRRRRTFQPPAQDPDPSGGPGGG